MDLSPFKLERYFAKYEFTTEYLLCSSDCEAMPIADLLALEDGAAEKFQNVWLGYTESQHWQMPAALNPMFGSSPP